MTEILWVDVETTGLDPKLHAIHQIGLINDTRSDVFNICPFNGALLSKTALDVGNVTSDQLKGYNYKQSDLIDFLFKHEYLKAGKKVIIAGYNTNFDASFIHQTLIRETGTWLFGSYCYGGLLDVMTLVAIERAAGRLTCENDKLSTVCEFYEIPLKAHNAMSDIKATKEIYNRLTKGDKV